jgi:CheY-like chemotaxis protein
MNDPSTWNVLIVDDEPDSVGVVEHIFVFHKARVRTASSGPACLDLLKQEVPNILFLDIQMPKLSGWEVLKQIRGDARLKDIVVIALTAHAMHGDRERILAAGFDGYFSKPISPLTFVKDVSAILEARRKHD